MSFDSRAFSQAMKIALADYLESDGEVAISAEQFLSELSAFNPKTLKGDKVKMAFWINLYNGLTNYQIIRHGLKKSVWELPGFFNARHFQVGEFLLSLDDIEHGILRKNGPRKNDKPRQFQPGDSRAILMVEGFDPRIHFALNCGSVSCPPLAFYSSENLEQELALAEANFVDQEFQVDHKKQSIRCSEIFIWYKADFPDQYLNDSLLSRYKVEALDYHWRIR